MKKKLANHEIVTLAVYLLGGDAQRVDTEDIAVKANEVAPGRFTWRKYPDQINIDTVRKRLWDAATSAKGEYLAGSEKQGRILTGIDQQRRDRPPLGIALLSPLRNARLNTHPREGLASVFGLLPSFGLRASELGFPP